MKNTFFNKTSELQLGDWVKLAYDKDNRCVKVICIYQNTIDTDYEGESLHGRYSDFEIEPIQITKELLEKNGFKENKGGYYAYRTDDEKNHVSYTFSCVPNSSIYITKDEYSEQEATFDVPRPYFVHELQHILRMFGLNDLADNFKI